VNRQVIFHMPKREPRLIRKKAEPEPVAEKPKRKRGRPRKTEQTK